jgi:hypothetical protein
MLCQVKKGVKNPMAVTIVYTEAKYRLSVGTLNLSTAVLKAMLVTSDYAVDRNHTVVDDGTLVCPSNFEVSGTGYVGGYEGGGRITLENVSVIIDEDTFRVRLFADDLIWSLINVGVIGGVILLAEIINTSDSESLLIGFTSAGGFPIPSDGGDLQVRWHVNGILAF